MVTIRWTADAGLARRRGACRTGRSRSTRPSMVLHYGQEIFEGLKAYRQPDGSIASFRPDANAARFRASAARLAMAAAARRAVPRLAGRAARRRPRVGAAGRRRGVAVPAPVHDGHRGRAGGAAVGGVPVLPDRLARPGPYFPGGVKPVDVWLCTDYTRAALGGTGTAKCGGNYAASLLPQAQGAEHGCAQVAYLDAEERALDRRDGLEQPVLRLRLRRPGRGGDARADRQHPARHHPRLAAGAGQGAGLPGHRAADLWAGVARRAPRTGGSPRCSAAAPPR